MSKAISSTEILNEEDIQVIDYDLGPEEGIADHDQVCVSQANKLLQIGYETAVYGSAYCSRDGEINYYISAKEDTMDKFLCNCYQQNIYPTPAKYFFKRYDLVNDTEEEIKNKALANENVKKHIENKEIMKIIVIKGKIVNIVVK